LQQRGVRMLIAGGLLVVLALILIQSIRGCRRDNLVDAYRSYLAGANQVADDSVQLGNDLRRVLENKDNKNPRDSIAATREIAERSKALVDRAEDLSPPDRLQEPHNTMITAMEYRRDALAELPGAIEAATKSGDANTGAATIAEPLRLLATSDVIYERSYRRPAETALRNDKIQDVRVNQSELFPGTTADLTSPTGARKILSSLRTVVQVPGGTGGARGTAIVSTYAVTASGRKIQLVRGSTTTVPAGQTSFEVTIENGGTSIESEVKVTLTYITPIKAEGTEEEQIIETISPTEPDKTKTVTFTKFGEPYNAAPSTVRVVVDPVPEETKTDNNNVEYTVQFSISG
jgi:hypothetical protein